MYDQEHERKAHTTLRLQQHTTMGWFFATESPWTHWHTGGSRQDTYGTPVPEEGRPWVARQAPHRDDPPHDKDKVLRQTCFQRTQVLTHLETYMVAEQRDDHMANAQ